MWRNKAGGWDGDGELTVVLVFYMHVSSLQLSNFNQLLNLLLPD